MSQHPMASQPPALWIQQIQAADRRIHGRPKRMPPPVVIPLPGERPASIPERITEVVISLLRWLVRGGGQ